MKRTTIKIAGESGMGLASVGAIIAKALQRAGFEVHLDREFPSLIKGGHSNVQIDFSTRPLHCLSQEIDIVMALDRVGLESYLKTIRDGGVLIHGYERHHLIKDLEEDAAKRNITLLYLPARQIAYSFGGNILMVNMVLLGLLWKVLGLPYDSIADQVKEEYADKKKILPIDLKCLDAGYTSDHKAASSFTVKAPKKPSRKLLMNGNQALALGAIHCGVRAYYAYPMSPSSSILTYMANWADQYKLIVKQIEDEISTVQMALGSMFMGTRALCATSGGGFDLMTETISHAAMIESPLVIIIAQRPGPATGLPTWTMQSDLNLAVYSAHGEFTRLVIAVSDPSSCFELVQHAMNYAEEFQIPVIILTEKVIAESQTLVEPFTQKHIPIKRGLVSKASELKKLKGADRFAITKSGVSKRWIPGSADAFYFGNSDEHSVDGTLTEESEPVKEMYAKRMRKQHSLANALPEPNIIGPKKADISFIGWGSSKGTMIDVINAAKAEGVSVNYLHFDYVWPLKTKALLRFAADNKNLHILEGNYTGQLANLIEGQTDLKLSKRFLKYDGRPFFLEEVLSYISDHL